MRPQDDPGSDGTVDPALQRAVEALAVPGLRIGHRVISPGDDRLLLDAERASITSSVIGVLRASGAARAVARQLLAHFGYGAVPIFRGKSGAPIWPAGVAGSMAHDDRIAVAAVGLASDIGSVGIDVEPAEPLPSDMLELIAAPRELAGISGDLSQGRLLFATKEAVYKAAYPLDQVFLEFRDIEIDLARCKAETRTGHVFTLRYCISPRIVVLALASA